MSALFKPVSIGPVAAEILAHPGDAEVAAVFERSFYLMTQHGFAAIGTEQLGDGPINLLLSGDGGLPDWKRFGITREAKGAVDPEGLTISDNFALKVSGVAVWRPAPWPRIVPARIAAGLAEVKRLAVARCPAEGLSRVVVCGAVDKSNPTAQAAAPTLADFARCLPHAIAHGVVDAACVRAATLLLGLGPGLTPSGDDVLGGMFLTLSALGATQVRDELWRHLAPEMDDLTVGISGAHLAAAADGLGAATVHDALGAILRDEQASLARQLEGLRRIGHSSGFDILAGIVLTLDAALASGMLSERL